ncbi:MAG: hypothetical protein ABJB86_06265 [Bacteroidota bacterium]
MTHTKSAGIWMGHFNAHVMEFTPDPIQTTNIESAFTNPAKEASLEKGEHLMHNKEQHQQLAYYKKLCSVIKNDDRILLFGRTNAKVKLFSILRADGQCKDIKIEVQQADKMTAPQEHAFVINHSSGRY